MSREVDKGVGLNSAVRIWTAQAVQICTAWLGADNMYIKNTFYYSIGTTTNITTEATTTIE